MGRKKENGSRRKVDTAKYRKRQRAERENRAIKAQKRVMAEFEFAQRIQSEPSLKELTCKEREKRS